MSMVYAHNTGKLIDTDFEAERICQTCGENEWEVEVMGVSICKDCEKSLDKSMKENE